MQGKTSPCSMPNKKRTRDDASTNFPRRSDMKRKRIIRSIEKKRGDSGSVANTRTLPTGNGIGNEDPSPSSVDSLVVTGDTMNSYDAVFSPVPPCLGVEDIDVGRGKSARRDGKPLHSSHYSGGRRLCTPRDASINTNAQNFQNHSIKEQPHLRCEPLGCSGNIETSCFNLPFLGSQPKHVSRGSRFSSDTNNVVTGGGSDEPQDDHKESEVNGPSIVSQRSSFTGNFSSRNDAGDFDILEASLRSTDTRSKQGGGLFSRCNGFLTTNNVYIMDEAFMIVGLSGIFFYLSLLAIVLLITPPEAFVHLSNPEFSATLVGSGLIFGSLVSKVVPILIKKGWHALNSGLMIGAMCVQLIAACNDMLMAAVRIPILLDPVTGARVYPYRYCAWTVLAFIMTFMTEGVHVPPDDTRLNYGFEIGCVEQTTGIRSAGMWHAWKLVRVPFWMGLSMCVSAVCGLIFPYLSSTISWTVWMVISCVLWLVLFPRLYFKRMELRRMGRGVSVDEKELYDRVRLSYKLLHTCVWVWSILVIAYFFASFAWWFVPEGHPLAHRSVTFLCEAVIDVIAKALYLDIIVDVHNAVFDDRERAARRLEELRRLMSVVWECSSDVIALSVRGHNGMVSTMLSPTFHKIEDLNDGGKSRSGMSDEGIEDEMKAKHIVFEMTADEFSDGQRKNGNERNPVLSSYGRRTTDIFAKNFSAIYCVDLSDGGHIYFHDEKLKAEAHPALSSIRSLMIKAWNGDESEGLLLHDVTLKNGGVLQCEAMSTKLGSNALIVVMRDISERFMCFEAEKRAVSEAIARKKDAEANRFTRHEVKNGLLAAIGLCDSLREAVADRSMTHGLTEGILTGNNGQKRDNDVAFKYLADLDTAVRDILDTVLAEAMVRDVIHEVYQPKIERVDLIAILSSVRGDDRRKRFQLVANPPQFPVLLLDPQLLKYIHRNAISNACKYGRRAGVVITEVNFHVERSELVIHIINLPGENHEKLVSLGETAKAIVFTAGERLHDISTIDGDRADVNNAALNTAHSSGDGAWISRKCARTLGGDCDIRFEKERTVFSLRCPARQYDMIKQYPGASCDPTKFRLPEDTWGVAIDDSKIQRKVMQRFFSVAGVPQKRQMILGKDAEEIRGFVDKAKDLIESHPNSFVLLIADENLDVEEDDNHYHTISGSRCIQKLRKELEPQREQRLLALVRSANDSASDVAIYNSRTHGFICKAPIQRDKIMEILFPLWAKRFGEHLPHTALKKTENISRSTFDADVNFSASVDVMQTLEVIDALCLQNSNLLTTRWPALWERIHSVKDDLKRVEQNQSTRETIDAINGLEGPVLPDNFLDRWAAIRAQIIRVI